MAEFLPLAQLLHRGRAPATPVAQRAGQRYDFAYLQQQAAAWQAAFAAQPGRRWALYCQDSLAFAATLLGAWQAGVCIYLPADMLPATQARLREQVDGFVGDWPAECAPLCAAANAESDFQPLDESALALVVYTSGSSGEPLALPKRLGQLFSEVEHLAACWPDLPVDALVHGTVSHQHIYGLLFRVLWPLAAGRPFAAERLPYPEDMVAALAQGPCCLVASPAHLKRLPEPLDWAPARQQLAALFSSGGPLPDEAVPTCLRLLGQAPREIYGSSETGGIAWRQRHDGTQTRWQALPGVALQLHDGQLAVRSRHLAEDDWYAVSDRVALDGDSFVLLGRADRIAKIEEKRVSLGGLEAALLASGLLAEARVLSLPGARTVLAVVAVPNAAGWALYDEAGKAALNARLRGLLAGQVEAAVLPRRWRYRWAMPSNSQGKTTEQALQALFDPRRPEARLLGRDAGQAQLRLAVSASCPYFDGHFAQAPILPGVAQIDWAVAFGRELFALPAQFLRLEAIKFQQVIVPASEVDLSLEFNAERASLGFRYHSAAGQHASGRIVFGATP